MFSLVPPRPQQVRKYFSSFKLNCKYAAGKLIIVLFLPLYTNIVSSRAQCSQNLSVFRTIYDSAALGRKLSCPGCVRKQRALVHLHAEKYLLCSLRIGHVIDSSLSIKNQIKKMSFLIPSPKFQQSLAIPKNFHEAFHLLFTQP